MLYSDDPECMALVHAELARHHYREALERLQRELIRQRNMRLASFALALLGLLATGVASALHH